MVFSSGTDYSHFHVHNFEFIQKVQGPLSFGKRYCVYTSIYPSIHTCIHTMHNIAIRNVRIMYFQGVKNLCKHSQILVSKIMILTFRQTASLIRSYRFILEPGYTPIAYKVRTTCNQNTKLLLSVIEVTPVYKSLLFNHFGIHN